MGFRARTEDVESRPGDEARFEELYRRCYGPIRDFCSRRVAAEAVDDAVADTFLTVWRRLDEVPTGNAALVWMYAVAHRVIGHQWRSASRRTRLHERLRSAADHSAPPADEAILEGDESRFVRAALANLTDAYAEVLRLVAWEHLTVADVATVLDIAPDAARQRMHRARRRLAREYDRLQPRPNANPAAPTGGAR